MDVTVYSPEWDCSQCMATKLRFRREDIPFSEVTASDDDIAAFKADGYASFPVVVVDFGDGASWTFSGYRHEDIKRLKGLWQDSRQVA